MPKTEFDPGPLAWVAQRREGSRITLVFRRDLAQPPARVWTALTDPAEVAGWAPFRPDRDLGQAGPALLQMIDGMSDDQLPSEVTRAVAPELLEYSWADGLVRWELAPHGEGTLLTLRHSVDDPDWLPKLAAGWHLCLVVAEGLMDGRDMPSMAGERAMDYGWQDLHDAYQRALAAGD